MRPLSKWLPRAWPFVVSPSAWGSVAPAGLGFGNLWEARVPWPEEVNQLRYLLR